MMHLPAHIDSSEKRLLQPLEDYFITKYKEGYLISHGLDHHRRVWRYAKELLHHIYLQKNNPESDLTDKLMIACYLHDIGMAIEQGEKHGLYSRSLVEEFLLINNLKKDDYLDVLQAVEHHDNKDYTGILIKHTIQTFLSAADDLDAFGYTGIWRYAEIYRLRNIALNLLGKEIQENAGKRFENFRSVFGNYPGLIERHTSRFYYLFSFFDGYNLQINKYTFKTKNPSGYCGVIEILSELTTGEFSQKSLFVCKSRYSNDHVITQFIEGLEKELLCTV